MSNKTKTFITATQAAKILNYATKARINQLRVKGELTGKLCECGHGYMYDKAEVEAFKRQPSGRPKNKP